MQEYSEKCNYANYHGHNYELIVKVTGEVDPVTGYVIDTKVLSDLVREHVIECFDHKNLNLDTLEFKELNPTAENIAVVIYDKLRQRIDLRYDLKLHFMKQKEISLSTRHKHDNRPHERPES